MNEEEKKAIEKFVEKCKKLDESVEIKGVSVGEEYRILETVCKALDLVIKLQKENEELKAENEYNKLLLDTNKNFTIDKKNRKYKRNVIEIQKEKEKKEEINKKEKEELKGMKGQDRYFVKQTYQNKKMILQELIKESED